MDQPPLDEAITRAERALERVERALAGQGAERGHDQALRDKVRGVVAELDEMIRAAGGR